MHILLTDLLQENSKNYEQIANHITQNLCDELGTTPRELMRGHCDTWAVAFKQLVPEAEIVETDVYSKVNQQGKSPCHTFIKIGNLYYDAEQPQGVNDPRELPFFNGYKNPYHLHKRGVHGTTHIKFPPKQ